MAEAETAMTLLCDSVEQLLASNQDLSRRLRGMDAESINRTAFIGSSENDASSTGLNQPAITPNEKMNIGTERNQYGFAFEEDLLASRVYKRPLFSNSRESLLTSAARSTASSILSALSISDVSNISILAVPIYAHEISNSRRYTFGDLHPKMLKIEEELSSTKPAEDNSKENKWGGLAFALRRRRRVKASVLETSSASPLGVFGVSLKTSIKYANVSISLTNEDGEHFIYGYIPMIVAKAGVFLKETGEFSWSCRCFAFKSKIGFDHDIYI
jgi:hypothetical protein